MNSHMRSAAETSDANLSAKADVMAQEFVLGFDDLRKNPWNDRRLMNCVRSHYVNCLKASDFCSALRRILTDNLIHQQRVIVDNFNRELSCLYMDHSMLEMKLKSMDQSFQMKLYSIDVSKQCYSVFFTFAAMICGAASPIVAVNAILTMSSARTWVAAAAAALAILFTALGRWRQSVQTKDENAVKKHRLITKYMIMGAEDGMEFIQSIYNAARKLDIVSRSLLETAYDREKVEAVENRFTEFLRKDEEYSVGMNRIKQLVIESIIIHQTL